jgi:hypothetical protein
MFDFEYAPDEYNLGRPIRPLFVPLDRALVAEALQHLRAQAPLWRKRWCHSLERVLDRFADRYGYRREPIHVGGGRVHVLWIQNRSGIGVPRTDIAMVHSRELRSFPKFQRLLSHMSGNRSAPAYTDVAYLVVASMIVRRDHRVRDYLSIRDARPLFDALRPAFARVAHDNIAEQNRLRAVAAEAAAARKGKAAAKEKPILEELERLKGKITRRHAAKRVAAALRDHPDFKGVKEEARVRRIRRVLERSFTKWPDPPVKKEKRTKTIGLYPQKSGDGLSPS